MDNTSLQILGVAGNALMVLGYFPQIRKIIVTRKAEDISLLTWIGYLTGDLCLLAYSLLTNDGVFVSLFTMFTVGNVTLIGLTIKYGKVHLPKLPKPAHKTPDVKSAPRDPAAGPGSPNQ